MEDDFRPDTEGKPPSDPTPPNIPREGTDPELPSVPSSPSFVELISHVRNCLTQLKDLVRLSEGRFVDKRFGEHFSTSLNKILSGLDTLLKEYLDYARVGNPLEKKGTIHGLIDDVLNGYGELLEEKGIKLFKKFEPNLPETTVPDDPLRFILRSLLWYALTWISPMVSMGFLSKTLPHRIETVSKDGTLLRVERQDIEVIIILSAHKEPLRFSETLAETPVLQREGIAGFMLHLIEETVRNNRGELKIETDGKKAWILFSLTFPVERRKKTYYRPAEA
jgi:hypothetical protein